MKICLQNQNKPGLERSEDKGCGNMWADEVRQVSRYQSMKLSKNKIFKKSDNYVCI